MNTNVNRSPDMASIVLLGLTGAGKSTTFSKLFGTNMDPVESFTSATSTILEHSIEVNVPGEGVKELIVIDTPGFGDTRQRAFERDAQLLATLEDYIKKHKHLGSTFPSVVMLVMKFDDDRIKHETSMFIQMLKALNVFVSGGVLVDGSSTCNLVVVLTHVMSEKSDDVRADPTPKIRMIEGLFKEYTTIPTPLFTVFAENKHEVYNLRMRKGYCKLPNGEYYPYNLFKVLASVTENANDIIANNIFHAAFKRPKGLSKTLKAQVPLMPVESALVNRYFIHLKNTRYKLENTEVFKHIEQIWTELDPSLTKDTGNALQHVQKCFHRNHIINLTDLPKHNGKILQILSQLPLIPAVREVLNKLDIHGPEIPRPMQNIGNFYNVFNDSINPTSPFDSGRKRLSNVGFTLPDHLNIEEVYDTNKVFYVCDDIQDYVVRRLQQLDIDRQVASDKVSLHPLPGYNIQKDLLKTGIATAVMEYRVYRVFLKRTSLSKEYLNYLQTLPTYKVKSKSILEAWNDFLAKGAFVVQSAFAGGCVTIRVNRNPAVKQTTSVESIGNFVNILMDNFGNKNCPLAFEEIKDFQFSIKFDGGDPNLHLPDIETIFTEEGADHFCDWEGSLKLHPKVLSSNIQVTSLLHYLPLNMTDVEKNIKAFLANTLDYTHGKKKRNGPVSRHKVNEKKQKEKCCIV